MERENKQMTEKAKVSVFCTAYNHEKYIRKCLEGFIMQKTAFPFEVIVHDDASTDGTADIIREYENKYPDIIKPIYQTENQYSKGVKFQKTFMHPKASGEYYAWCEGDDCWTDENKLQKQVEFLDTHPDYSCCYHKVFCLNLMDGSNRYIPAIDHPRDFKLDEIIRKGAVFHISSFVIRADCYRMKPDWFTVKGAGDFPLYIYAAICGKCYVLNDVMSTYNHGTAGSWTKRVSQNKTKNLEHEKRLLAMLNRVKEYYGYTESDAFNYAIDRAQFNILILSGEIKKARSEKYRQFYLQHKKQQRVYFLRKYFPFLRKIKRFLNGRIKQNANVNQ